MATTLRTPGWRWTLPANARPGDQLIWNDDHDTFWTITEVRASSNSVDLDIERHNPHTQTTISTHTRNPLHVIVREAGRGSLHREDVQGAW